MTKNTHLKIPIFQTKSTGGTPRVPPVTIVRLVPQCRTVQAISRGVAPCPAVLRRVPPSPAVRDRAGSYGDLFCRGNDPGELEVLRRRHFDFVIVALDDG